MTRMGRVLRRPRRALLERHRQLLGLPDPAAPSPTSRCRTAPRSPTPSATPAQLGSQRAGRHDHRQPRNGGRPSARPASSRPAKGMTVAVAFQKGILVDAAGHRQASATGSPTTASSCSPRSPCCSCCSTISSPGPPSAATRSKGTDHPAVPSARADLSPAHGPLHQPHGLQAERLDRASPPRSSISASRAWSPSTRPAARPTSPSTGAAPPTSCRSASSSVYDYIHAKGTVTIDKTDGPALNEQARRAGQARSRPRAARVYFKNNVAYTLGGVALAALLLGALVWLDVLEPVVLIIAVVAAIVIGVFIGVA